MFSTTLTCLDAFPRVCRTATQIMVPNAPQDEGNHKLYWIWIIIVAAGAMVILTSFVDNMKQMVMVATIISFLTAPLLAILNYLAVTHENFPKEARPGRSLRILSIAGIVYLLCFCVLYILNI